MTTDQAAPDVSTDPPVDAPLDFGPVPGAEYTINTDPVEEAKTFELTKPVNLAQLVSEIAKAAGLSTDDVTAALTTPDAGPVSDSNKGTLWLTPGSIDGRTVRGCLTAHDPDPTFGLSDERKAQITVIEKIRAGETLTPEEMQTALHALLASAVA